MGLFEPDPLKRSWLETLTLPLYLFLAAVLTVVKTKHCKPTQHRQFSTVLAILDIVFYRQHYITRSPNNFWRSVCRDQWRVTGLPEVGEEDFRPGAFWVYNSWFSRENQSCSSERIMFLTQRLLLSKAFELLLLHWSCSAANSRLLWLYLAARMCECV